ncbi:MAG TPA: DUF5668 domain-containing protein [Acidobacteriota bacterium]|nr:DUF5668 domain-containing protein [Acidobacteriota bacterium]
MGSNDKCKDTMRGRLTAGFILTGIGLVFLLSNIDVIPSIEDSWPLLLVVVGGALLFGAMRDRKKRGNDLPPDASTQDGVPPS